MNELVVKYRGVIHLVETEHETVCGKAFNIKPIRLSVKEILKQKYCKTCFMDFDGVDDDKPANPIKRRTPLATW